MEIQWWKRLESDMTWDTWKLWLEWTVNDMKSFGLTEKDASNGIAIRKNGNQTGIRLNQVKRRNGCWKRCVHGATHCDATYPEEVNVQLDVLWSSRQLCCRCWADCECSSWCGWCSYQPVGHQCSSTRLSPSQCTCDTYERSVPEGRCIASPFAKNNQISKLQFPCESPKKGLPY